MTDALTLLDEMPWGVRLHVGPVCVTASWSRVVDGQIAMESTAVAWTQDVPPSAAARQALAELREIMRVREAREGC